MPQARRSTGCSWPSELEAVSVIARTSAHLPFSTFSAMLSLITRGVAPVVVTLTLLGCVGTTPQDTPAPEGVARDFLTMATDGTEISGESFLGHVTIVDFWAVF